MTSQNAVSRWPHLNAHTLWCVRYHLHSLQTVANIPRHALGTDIAQSDKDIGTGCGGGDVELGCDGANDVAFPLQRFGGVRQDIVASLKLGVVDREGDIHERGPANRGSGSGGV